MNVKVIKRTMILCSILLFITFVIKIFGVNYFQIIINNSHFISISNWLDNSWVKYIFSTIIYMTNCYLLILIILKEKIQYKNLWYLLLFIPNSYLKSWNSTIGLIYDSITLCIIPCIILIIKYKYKWYKSLLRILVVNIITIIFQYISLMTKNLGGYFTNESLLVSTILTIDYYTMLILYYLYIQYQQKEIK